MITRSMGVYIRVILWITRQSGDGVDSRRDGAALLNQDSSEFNPVRADRSPRVKSGTRRLPTRDRPERLGPPLSTPVDGGPVLITPAYGAAPSESRSPRGSPRISKTVRAVPPVWNPVRVGSTTLDSYKTEVRCW